MPRRKVIAIGRPVRDSDLEGILKRTGFQPSQVRRPGRVPKKPVAPAFDKGTAGRRSGARARYS
jgi:hypothetical protein